MAGVAILAGPSLTSSAGGDHVLVLELDELDHSLFVGHISFSSFPQSIYNKKLSLAKQTFYYHILPCFHIKTPKYIGTAAGLVPTLELSPSGWPPGGGQRVYDGVGFMPCAHRQRGPVPLPGGSVLHNHSCGAYIFHGHIPSSCVLLPLMQ